MHAHELPFLGQDPDHDRPIDADDSLPNERTRGRTNRNAVIDEEVLTYLEAAKLLKISARTLERWTREGLVPYIRLPQRGRWSGVRFSRTQLLRWLRHRTVRSR